MITNVTNIHKYHEADSITYQQWCYFDISLSQYSTNALASRRFVHQETGIAYMRAAARIIWLGNEYVS